MRVKWLVAYTVIKIIAFLVNDFYHVVPRLLLWGIDKHLYPKQIVRLEKNVYTGVVIFYSKVLKIYPFTGWIIEAGCFYPRVYSLYPWVLKIPHFYLSLGVC